MDTALLVAGFVIFGLPILIIGIAALFPPDPNPSPYFDPKDWGNQDLDQNLNK